MSIDWQKDANKNGDYGGSTTDAFPLVKMI